MLHRVFLLLFAIATPTFLFANDGATSDWPQFRGPNASGVADGAGLPVTWNVETGENIRWKTAIPGMGHASPIVLGDRVFIVTAVSSEKDEPLRIGRYGDIDSVDNELSHSWQLYCLCKHTGQILWKRTVHEGVPQIKRHTKATHANSTPAASQNRVVVSLGSEGLYCYDMRGSLCWNKDLGKLDSGYFEAPEAQWGFGSSPIVYNNMVIVQCDVQQNSFIAAFDLHDGRELWRTPRADVPTWSTPTVVERSTRTELVVNGYKHAGGYDPPTGKELWKLSGGGDIPVPTPIAAHGLVFLTSAHGSKRPLCAVREGATGDITPADDAQPNEHFAWYLPRGGTYMQTPIVYGDFLYACRDNGLMTCYEAQTGEEVYRKRLGQGSTGFTASPVAGDGKLYFTSEEGQVYVLGTGAEFELLATNSMNEVCMATPAISAGQLIVRTEGHVYSLGAPAPDAKERQSTRRRTRATGSASADRRTAKSHRPRFDSHASLHWN